MDFITVGTAFHWFDIEKTKLEFKRILKSTGWVLLVWNVRDIEGSALLKDYENLINKYMPGYHKVNAKRFDQTVLESFFAPQVMKVKSYKNSQQFDWQGFKGRLFSSSYSLRPQSEHYEEMLDNLKTIFNRYQKNGLVEFLYNTKLYYGQLNIF